VGLKRSVLNVEVLNVVKQQSHHCGIETPVSDPAASKHGQPQQSHHCGIETYREANKCRSPCSSNRTIVGLKPLICMMTLRK